MSKCGDCVTSSWDASTGCGDSGTADWTSGCENYITEREELYTTYPWVDWNNAHLDILFDECDKKIAISGNWVVHCSQDGGSRGLFQGYDPAWYNVTPGDLIYISEGNIGTTSNQKALSLDLYKLIAFTDLRVRACQYYDCGLNYHARDSVTRDKVNGGFQNVFIEPYLSTITNDITQPGGVLDINYGGTVYALAGTPCDHPTQQFYYSGFTFVESSSVPYDWDYFVSLGHSKLYDLDNNRYKDTDQTYVHTDLPWDPLIRS